MIPSLMVAGVGVIVAPFVPPNPNNFDYYRRGQPIIGLKAKVDNKGFDYYRRLQPDPAMVVIS